MMDVGVAEAVIEVALEASGAKMIDLPATLLDRLLSCFVGAQRRGRVPNAVAARASKLYSMMAGMEPDEAHQRDLHDPQREERQFIIV